MYLRNNVYIFCLILLSCCPPLEEGVLISDYRCHDLTIQKGATVWKSQADWLDNLEYGIKPSKFVYSDRIDIDHSDNKIPVVIDSNFNIVYAPITEAFKLHLGINAETHTPVSFWSNGKIQSFYLNRSMKINGVICEKGYIVAYHSDGQFQECKYAGDVMQFK